MNHSASLAEAVRWAERQLQEAGQASSKIDAESLLCHLLQKNRSYLYTWPEHRLSPTQSAAYRQLIQRRTRGEPVAYLTGHREFWSLDLQVTPAVLIPRADTERLVELALRLIDSKQPTWIADLGTGSGAIAAAIASERPHARIIATDRSAAALAVANANFQRLGLRNVTTALGFWCQALPAHQQFDMIVSNPPYIADQDTHLQRGDLSFEPLEALSAGPEGLDDLCQICPCAFSRLNPSGHLLVEHGYGQGEMVRRLFQTVGFSQVETHLDLEGRERVTEGCK